MPIKAIKKFNFAMGNAPADTPAGILDQIKTQCSYLVEEVLEVKEGCRNGDWENVLKEVADVNFVAAYLRTLVEAAGCDYGKAFRKVCDNNMQKFTTSFDLAEKWLHERKDVDGCHIEETEFDGVSYFCVRRDSDGKLLKFKDFPEVNLKRCLPKELKND